MKFHFLRQDDGFALAFALLVCVVLTISTVSVVTYTSSGSRSSSVSSSRVNAQDVAEAGLNAAMSIISQGSNAAAPDLLGCSVSGSNGSNSATPCNSPITISASGGTASVTGLYTSGSPTGTWAITSTGTVTNPTGGASLSKTMSVSVQITPGGQVDNVSIWNYVYSTAPQGAGCEVDLTGDHTVVDVPLYVTGDLCLSGDHAQILEDKKAAGQPVDVRVGGTLSITGNDASVGQDAGHPITSGVVAGGCRTTIDGTFHPCTVADRYYVGLTDSALDATPPTTDFPGWYLDASPGPNHPCDPALTPAPSLLTTQPQAFDNDTTMNGTNTDFNLTPSDSDYNCVTSTGYLNWNHTTHVLSIGGTIFFDGSVYVSDPPGPAVAMYDGRATIYVNGEISLNAVNHGGGAGGLRAGCSDAHGSNDHPCDFNADKTGPNHWDPNQDMLVFVANKSSGIAVDLSVDHSQFQGDIMCPPTSTIALAGDHTQYEGGIICGNYTFGNHTQIWPMPVINASNMPDGAPNSPATIGSPTLTGG
jgi:Tfp pilus assembly protein PilX